MKTSTNGIFNLFHKLSIIFSFLKTQFFYRIFFGNIGFKSILFKPIKLINPKGIFIGNFVQIFKNNRIELIYKWNEQKFQPKVMIGSYSTFEQNLHLTCAESILIGNYVTIMADVLITDIHHSYLEINKPFYKQNLLVKKVVIGDFSVIGMGVKILPGTVLGENCIVGANSVLNSVYKPYSLIVGSPGKVIKRYDLSKNIWRKVNSEGDFIYE